MNYHNITYPDMNNGDGLRVVLWLSGCSHKCIGCQNPQTWNPNSGIIFDKSAREELFRELSKDYISGITLSGGDPLFESNLDDVLELVMDINEQYSSSQNKTIWLYTGYTWDDIIAYQYPNDAIVFSNNQVRCMHKRQQIISKCDVVIDGEYIDTKRDVSLKWRGSSNQRVIDCKKTIESGEIVLWCN